MKQKLVQDIFSTVALKYGLMNDLMSFGLHRCWKRRVAREITGYSLIDVATGTGDIALARASLGSFVLGVDLNWNMLEVARDRALESGSLAKLIQANAENLPINNDSFDCYTIVFGLRNVTNIQQALTEAFRVLKSGGKFICLEFAPVKTPIIKQFYDLYSFFFIPKLGRIVTGSESSYRYLVESIRNFPQSHEIKRMLEESGFCEVKCEPINMGIANLYTGYKAQ